MTSFWDNRQHIPSEINTKSICHNYRTGKCHSGVKCKKLHICKEFKLSTGCARMGVDETSNGRTDDCAIIDTEDPDDFVECIIKSLSGTSAISQSDMHFVQSP
jgi:hypothetical protein